MPVYNLANNFAIYEYKDGSLRWETYGMGYPEEGDLFSLRGKCWIEEGILFLTAWKVIDGLEDGYTLDDVYNSLYELPKWNKTKYFMKGDDFRNHYICYCESGEGVPDEEVDPIMKKLGYYNAGS